MASTLKALSTRMLEVYVFGEFPNCHPSWTVAVTAVSLSDARRWSKAVYHGGKMLQKCRPHEEIKAACGAITDEAQRILHEKLEAELEK